jgi:hypothetical protein
VSAGTGRGGAAGGAARLARMPTREELEALPSSELHDRATRLAWRRLDIAFLWDLLKTIPEARAAAGDDERSETDIMRPLALLNDLLDADRCDLAEALRPLYVDYLLEHADADDEAESTGDAQTREGDDG